MDAPTSLGIPRAFQMLADPRKAIRTHRFIDILTIALLAVICNAEDWVHVAAYGRAKQEWLQTFLDLPAGIPSHDTFNRTFARLDPAAFEACFRQWTATLAELSGGTLVAIDGKTLRASFEHAWNQCGITHMVSAFVQATHLVFAQEKTDGKGQELDAIKKLLQVLDLHGAVPARRDRRPGLPKGSRPTDRGRQGRLSVAGQGQSADAAGQDHDPHRRGGPRELRRF
jgi:hypothetical protein